MPGIRDTAYPQLKRTHSAGDLEEVYTPSLVELVWAEKRTRERAPRRRDHDEGAATAHGGREFD